MRKRKANRVIHTLREFFMNVGQNHDVGYSLILEITYWFCLKKGVGLILRCGI